MIASYIKFCEDENVQTKKVKIYPNSKPYINRELKQLIVDKNKLFAEGKKVEGKIADKEIKKQIRKNRIVSKEKMEEKYFSGDVRGAYKGIKKLVGKEVVKEKGDGMTEEERKVFAEDLNKFYCRFDRFDFSKEREEECKILEEKAENKIAPEVTVEEVEKVFRKINPRKACGPDSISGKVVRTFSKELAPIYCDVFNQTLVDHEIPDSWKAATICPVPKKSRPSTLNDYRPIALTSVLMKSLERLVLRMLKEEAKDELDSLQFAYRHNRGVEDAVLALIHDSLAHINNKGSYVRILYVDFSSAFNTVQTHLLLQKLQEMNICPHLTLWISDFLSNRTQTVCIKQPQTETKNSNPDKAQTNTHCFSSTQSINTGTPQGTVISPFIFTLYTNDCRSTHDQQKTYKFSDDTAIVDFSESETIFEDSVSDFSGWCDQNFLELNVGKTKEMVVDFKRNRTDVGALQIRGQTVERVEEYRYLGTIIDNKFNFEKNVESIHKKCRQRMVILYQLRSLMVSNKILTQCYRSFVESILTFSFICWFGSLNLKNSKNLDRVVKQCSKIVGKQMTSLSELYRSRVISKAMKIYKDPSHCMNPVLELLPSNRRYRTIRCNSTRFSKSFFPTAIRFLNDK